MSEYMHIEWQATKQAVTDFQNLLRCGLCKTLVKKPCTLGGCEHFFCRECMRSVKGTTCPQCHVPSHVKDVQTNRQLNYAVLIIKQLQNLLSHGSAKLDKSRDVSPHVTKNRTVASPESKVGDVKHQFLGKENLISASLEDEDTVKPRLDKQNSSIPQKQNLKQHAPAKRGNRLNTVQGEPEQEYDHGLHLQGVTIVNDESDVGSDVLATSGDDDVNLLEEGAHDKRLDLIQCTPTNGTPPISGRTRLRGKIQRKKERLHENNIRWSIGQPIIQRCDSCRKTNKRVQFLSQSSQESCVACSQTSVHGDVNMDADDIDVNKQIGDQGTGDSQDEETSRENKPAVSTKVAVSEKNENGQKRKVAKDDNNIEGIKGGSGDSRTNSKDGDVGVDKPSHVLKQNNKTAAKQKAPKGKSAKKKLGLEPSEDSGPEIQREVANNKRIKITAQNGEDTRDETCDKTSAPKVKSHTDDDNVDQPWFSPIAEGADNGGNIVVQTAPVTHVPRRNARGRRSGDGTEKSGRANKKLTGTDTEDKLINKNEADAPITAVGDSKRTNTSRQNNKAHEASPVTTRKTTANVTRPSPNIEASKRGITKINIGRLSSPKRRTRRSLSPSNCATIASPKRKSRRSLSPRGGGNSPSVTCAPKMGTPVNRVKSRRSLGSPASNLTLDTSLSSPAISKKNAQGETPLQVACIKGDLTKARELLAEGAEANVKDNAGWTPLHEACNHGYLEIARLLLDNGAYINTPGLDNDTPLHDSINNNRVDIIKLLVSRGARTDIRNIHGKTAVDLCFNAHLKQALNTPVKDEFVITSQMDVSLSQPVHNIVALPTGLNREQRNTLAKCMQMLHGTMVEEFSPKVSHIVTGVNKNGQCPRTMKYLQAIITGKWIVTFDWVETCLEYKDRVSEEAFEVPGTSQSPDSMAPYKARNNMLKQLPGLFSGCQFYLKGEFSYPSPSREELSALITLGGGSILTREPRLESIEQSEVTVPYHANPSSSIGLCSYYIVCGGKGKEFSGQVKGSRLAEVPISWVTDSIGVFTLMDL